MGQCLRLLNRGLGQQQQQQQQQQQNEVQSSSKAAAAADMAGNKDDLVLQAELGLFLGKKAHPVILTLHSDCISIKSSTACFGKKGKTASVTVHLSNVIGSQTLEVVNNGKNGGKNSKGNKVCAESESFGNGSLELQSVAAAAAAGVLSEELRNCAFFSLYYFEDKDVKEGGESLKAPKAGEYVFKVDSGESFDHNFAVAKKWRNCIAQQLQLTRQRTPIPKGLHHRLDRKKRLLILVNPKSGPGKALKIFRETIEPLLQQSDLLYDLVITKRSNHCQDLIATEGLDRWAAVVIVSGDGLLYELFQGLFKRSDWKESKNIPIAIIAGGSGNGLARTLCHEAGRQYHKCDHVGATLALVKGLTRKLDLICLETFSGKTVYSFLSVGTGFLSDVDIESEKLRFLGEPRFVLWAIYRVAVLRAYKAIITYKPCDSKNEGYKITHQLLGTPQNGDDGSLNEDNDDNDDYDRYTKEPREETDFADFSRQISERNASQPWKGRDDYESVGAAPVNRPPFLHLKPFGEELREEEGWVRVEDKFLIIYVVNVGYIGSNLKIAPPAKSDDGFMWLLMVRKGISKTSFTRVISAVETGSHINMPGVEMIPVKAFRLEPKSPKGFITVDGELLDYEPIQAEVMPSLANIVA